MLQKLAQIFAEMNLQNGRLLENRNIVVQKIKQNGGPGKNIVDKDKIIFVTRDYLINNPDHIFVFGDNLLRRGHGGAAKHRDLPNTYGFVTKKIPNNEDRSFFRPEEYQMTFDIERNRLEQLIINNPNNLFLISKLGAGLANKYNIFELIIQPGIEYLKKYKNVKFLY